MSEPFRETDFVMIKAKAAAFLCKLESPRKFPQTTPEAQGPTNNYSYHLVCYQGLILSE